MVCCVFFEACYPLFTVVAFNFIQNNFLQKKYVCFILSLKATELAELTSKITLLEDAKKKKEDEARKWQKRVRV